MKLYFAPLEGITSYIYRKALYQCFDGFDKYFIPFIRAKQNLNFSGREKKDISPENNSGMYAVPQILTRNADDFKRIHAQFPNVECFMMGRGILADPSLAREIRGGKAADQSDIRRFHDLLYHTYREEVSGDRNVLFKMKEIWFYLAPMFADSKKYAKKIKKSERCVVYESAVNELFANCRFTGTQSK